MLKFYEISKFLKFLKFLEKIPILKEFEGFEWFEWFGPSPIEPFNSGGGGSPVAYAGGSGSAVLQVDNRRARHRGPRGLRVHAGRPLRLAPRPSDRGRDGDREARQEKR